MKRLFDIVLVIQVIGGGIFFAALFVAPMPLSIKILCALGLMFISSAVFLLMVNQLALAESLRAMNDKASDVEREPRYSSVLHRLSQIHGGMRLQTTDRLGYLLLAMFAIWGVLGWALRSFVL